MFNSITDIHDFDFMFVNFGIHDYPEWNHETTNVSFGQQYHELALKHWLHVRRDAIVPSVWVSFNAPCISHSYANKKFNEQDRHTVVGQANQLETTSYYVHEWFQRDKVSTLFVIYFFYCLCMLYELW
jgi:hypothetical protein